MIAVRKPGPTQAEASKRKAAREALLNALSQPLRPDGEPVDAVAILASPRRYCCPARRNQRGGRP